MGVVAMKLMELMMNNAAERMVLMSEVKAIMETMKVWMGKIDKVTVRQWYKW